MGFVASAGGGIAMESDGLGGFPSSFHLVELAKVRRDRFADTLVLNCVFPSHLDAPEAVRYL